jgi:hypothetical protein
MLRNSSSSFKLPAMQQQTSSLDPRYFQVGFQALFLAYGIFFLHWYNDWLPLPAEARL